MVCQPLRLALLIGAITAVAVSPVRANHGASSCCDPCAPACTAPTYRTVTCTEWVKEAYQVKRCAYKVECRTETYDTCRTECVPVCKDVCYTVVKKIPVWKEECRKVCHNVTCYEDRVVNKTCYKYENHTCYKKKLVCLGHWECREVKPLFGGHGCGDCCNSCCTPVKTRKVWVHCPVYEECPYTVCKKVAYCVPTCCKVAVCKQEWREEKCKVCTYQCVTEQCTKKVTCYESRQVACKATRTVRVCVPYEECVTCYKMVPRTVCRQVPCETSCQSNCCGHSSLFSRLRHNSDCCRPTCCH